MMNRTLHFRTPIIAITLLVMCCSRSEARTDPPRYVVTDLGTLGGDWSWAFDINNHSQIVGFAETEEFSPPPLEGPVRRAFLWQNGVITALPPLPSPYPYSGEAHAISDSGHIVGSSSTSIFSSSPVLWWNGSVISMGAGPAEFCSATGVNEDGVAVGTCMSDYTGSGHAFRWSSDDGLDVIVWPSGNQDASAEDIDENGTIAGGFGPLHGAFLWNDGNMITVMNGTNGGIAHSINKAGQVVGTYSNPLTRAFLWSDGQAIDIGTLGRSFTAARDINDHGWIVGESWIPGGGAFLWIDGEMHDLNDLITDPNWLVAAAYAINNKNEIVGSGTNSQGPRGFLLTPVGPGDVNGDGDVNVVDLLALINSWGACPALGDCFADFDGNGQVNVADLLTLIENWGSLTPPIAASNQPVTIQSPPGPRPVVQSALGRVSN